MTRPNLIDLVLVKLDEMLPEGQESILLDEPTPINEYIDSLLDEAATDVLLVAPMHLAVNALDDYTAVEGQGSPDYFPLPADFLRVNAIMHDGWVNPVTTLIDRMMTPERYMMVRNAYAGAGINRPAAALSERMIGTPTPVLTKVIEPFPTLWAEGKAQGTISYVKKQVAEDCNEQLQPIIASHCAYKIAGAGGKTSAKYLAEEVQRQLASSTAK